MTLTSESSIINNKQTDEDIERLREWLLMQPHLPHKIDDDILKSFVQGTKSPEIAKQKLDAWFTARGKVPQMFSYETRNPFDPAYKEADQAIKIWFMPKPTPEGYRIFMVSMGKDFSKFNHTQKIIRCTMMVEAAMTKWPEMTGLFCVYDLDKVPSNVITKLDVGMTAAGLQWLQNALPFKLKKAVVINTKPFIEKIMATIIKPFLKEKLYNRIVISSEDDKFLKSYLSDDLIPKDYGGTAEHSDKLNDEWVKILEDKADWYKHLSTLTSDEKKRPADKAHSYGVEGTFRTLAID